MPRKPRSESYAKSIPFTSVEKKDILPAPPGKGTFIFTGPRAKLSQDGQSCTYYPDGRVRVSPKVARWMQEQKWEFAEFQVPVEGYPLQITAAIGPDFAANLPSQAAVLKRDPASPPATHLVIRGSDRPGHGNILTFRPDGFAEFRELSMYPNLMKAWPTNEWTTACQIIDDDCIYHEHVNKIGVVVPTHPSVQTRKVFRKRGVSALADVKRARRPEVGDLYGNSECTRLVLAILAALRDEDARITYLETDLGAAADDPMRQYEQTISLAGFRNWISMGAKLLEPSLL